MQVLTSLDHAKINPQGCAAAIGNFDGVHLGHQAIIQQLQNFTELTSTVIIFEPQPLEFFQGNAAPARLTNLEEKLFWLEQYGVEQVVVLRFDAELKNLAAEDFITQILLEKLNVKQVIVGNDFRFGRDRKGNIELLQQNQHFTTALVSSVMIADERISSSRIRQALAQSQFDLAQQLLGRPYSMRGEVLHGEKIGRTIGVPTANLDPKRTVLPLSGVFVVEVKQGDQHYAGVANLGTRPTVNGVHPLLEPYLFDFNGDLYGQTLEVIFRHKLRDEAKFASFAEMEQQIQRDITDAKAWYQQHS